MSAKGGAVWQTPLARGRDSFLFTAGEGIVVAGEFGAPLMSFDAVSGAPCATLVVDDASTSIEPNRRMRIAHGMLIGSAGFAVGAIDLRSGATRWTHDVIGGDSYKYELRDSFQVVATGSAVVVGFRIDLRDHDDAHYQELVTALDPATGTERWRVLAVDHPPGEPVPMEGTLLLASDPDRVYVRSPGRLVALDGATGARMWSVTWPVPPPVTGPRKPGPIVASDGDHVALSVPGQIRVFDARTGTLRGEVAVSGEVPHLVARAGGVYAAVEATPGTSTVIAIEAGVPRTLWTYQASYAVRQLRVDDELVYVLDGNRRIWGLERASARPRFGMNGEAFDFEPTRSPTGAPRIIVARTPLAAFDPSGPPPPLQPFARWEVNDGATGCQPHALSWIDGDDRVVWQRPLPPRVQSLWLGMCDELELVSYRRRPRIGLGHTSGVLGILDAGDAIVEADVTGVLALHKRDGAIALDTDARGTRSFWFGNGTFELAGLPGCKGDTRDAFVFTRCGDHIVYFNGRVAMIIATDTLTVEARGSYASDASDKRLGRADVRATSIAVGPYMLKLDGMIDLR